MENKNGIIYGGDALDSNVAVLDEGKGSLGGVILNDLALGGNKPLFVSDSKFNLKN